VCFTAAAAGFQDNSNTSNSCPTWMRFSTLAAWLAMAQKALSCPCLRLLTQHAMRGLSPRRCRCWRSRVGTKSACCTCEVAIGRLAAVGAPTDRTILLAVDGLGSISILVQLSNRLALHCANAFALASCSSRHACPRLSVAVPPPPFPPPPSSQPPPFPPPPPPTAVSVDLYPRSNGRSQLGHEFAGPVRGGPGSSGRRYLGLNEPGLRVEAAWRKRDSRARQLS
jgi:hypothetical protein